MGNEERAEVSKIASIYKLRCRYGKSTQLAPSTLIKARYNEYFDINECEKLVQLWLQVVTSFHCLFNS